MRARSIPRRWLTFACLASSGLALPGCSSLEPRIPYTSAQADAAQVVGLSDVRFYGDAPAFVFERWGHEVFAQAGLRHQPVSYLALSSGGSDGAFGAGLLTGLSRTGRRPQFTIVSGVSTGALMAPFAFLGPAYDPVLQDIYTSGYAAALVKDASLLNGVFGNALVDSDKLGRLIARYVDQNILDAVAAEHRKGRRLLIVSTDLDAQRSVVWDMGAIASTRSPRALPLFRQVLAASASVPGLFPPRLIDVESGGQTFQELHADGATLRQIYVAPDEIMFGAGRPGKAAGRLADIYVVVNNKIEPTFDVVENSTVGVAARALTTVVKREGRADVLSAYGYAASRGIGYHLAYIDADAPEPPAGDPTEQFSTAFMTKLFERGVAQGRSAAPWTTRPPLASDPAGQSFNASR